MYAVAVSPDSKRVAAASFDGTIVQWCVQAAIGRRINTLHGHTDVVRRVEYSADSTLLLSGSGDATVRIWDVSSGTQLRVFAQPSGVWCVGWLPGKPDRFVVADYVGGMRLCDATSGATIRAFDNDKHVVFALCFPPDGARLVAGTNGGVRVFDVASGRCVACGLRVLRNVRFHACMHGDCGANGVCVCVCVCVSLSHSMLMHIDMDGSVFDLHLSPDGSPVVGL